MSQGWEFAVLEQGRLVEVTDNAMEAAEVAGMDTDAIRANPYYAVTPGDVMGMDELTGLLQRPSSGLEAYRQSGLPQVSGEEVMRLTDDLTNPQRVFDRLAPFFEHLPFKETKQARDPEKFRSKYKTPEAYAAALAKYEVTKARGKAGPREQTTGSNWRDPWGLVESILGGNEKVNMEREGIRGTIKGLTLVPFWRNLQDEYVLDLDQKARDAGRQHVGKELLRQVEQDFDISKPPKEGGKSIPGNWCIGSSWACRRACLIGTGNNYTPYSFLVKFAKSQALKNDPVAFCAALAMNAKMFQDTEAAAGRRAFVRLNMLSDLPWEVIFPDLFTLVDNVQYYDYSKIDVHTRNFPSNYDITYSFNGDNDAGCGRALEAGHRIAVVFVSPDPSRKSRKDRVTFEEAVDVFGDTISDPFDVPGEFPFVNGNENDFRPADPQPSVVFLSYKSPGGVSPEDKEAILYGRGRHGGFPVPVSHATVAGGIRTGGSLTLIPQAEVVPVKRVGGALITAHTPLQNVFMPVETDAA